MLRSLSVLATVLAVAATKTEAAPPNIVVILADDSGYNEFTLNGQGVAPTPRIDSIARDGVRFTQGYTSGSVCSPTRAGLLTGRYQHRFGHEFNIPAAYSETNGLNPAETTIADVLQSANYRTLALGKWHLGYAPKFHPVERGFTDYLGFLQGSRSYFPVEKPSRLNQLLRDRQPIKPETFDYMTDFLAEQAAAYIVRFKETPFFMYLAFNATHTPLHATQADLVAAGGNKVKAMAIALDRAVGVILDELDRQSLTENTLVFFLVDNGGATGRDNSPLRDYKGSVWEGGIRVPFTMKWPARLPKGKVYTEPVISLDIFPTAMAAAGISRTTGQPLDGVNLLPYLTGETPSRPHPVLFWKNNHRWAVREGDLKLVVDAGKDTHRDSSPALFDLSRDLSEMSDLSVDRPADVERLRKLYEEWKKEFPPTPWGPGADSEREAISN